MLKKIVILCGPELADSSSRLDDLRMRCLQYSSDPLVIPHQIYFPEKTHGAEGVRNMVRFVIGCMTEDKVDKLLIVATRYGDALEAVGHMIVEGLIDHSLVVVDLFNDGVWDKHRFTGEGFMDASWPFGVLE